MISGRIHKMQASTATSLFVVYSALNGATLLCHIPGVRGIDHHQHVFCVLGHVRGLQYFHGYTTRRDLTSMGGFLTMGLIGIVIASLVNMFFQSGAVSTIVSYVGVLVFVGLTAYDTRESRRRRRSRSPTTSMPGLCARARFSER